MNCEQFEQTLQRAADGQPPSYEVEQRARAHVQQCSSCRELEEGLRLLTQAFVVSRVPSPPPQLADRVLADVLPASGSPRRRLFATWQFAAAAAGLLMALGWWWSSQRPREPAHPTLVSDSPVAPELPAPEELLFPDMDDPDPQQPAVLLAAVEPMSQALRAAGRSLENPVRPIAMATSEAIGILFRELPDPNFPAMPSMRGLMTPTVKEGIPPTSPSS